MTTLKQIPFYLVIAAVFFILGCQGKTVSGSETNTLITSFAPSEQIKSDDTVIKIAAGGDIMLASTFPNESRMPPNDGADLKTGNSIFRLPT